MKETTLEVCVDSLESAAQAELGGATRFELCANLVIGGTTPALSLFREIRRETDTEINVLLRPRFGDFLYTNAEFLLLLEDGKAFLQEGAHALVSGFLTPDGELDAGRIRRMTELAHSCGARFTLHRAFDVCRDPFEALRLCREIGVDTILTSGQAASCVEGLPVLRSLWEHRGRVELLVGAGVDAKAIRAVRAEIPEARSFHMSGKKVCDSAMRYRKQGVSMGLDSLSEFQLWCADRNKIQEAWKELNCL